jgi:CheY-like chemotaxis protein/anti-sigma regulatory factor (Ser/Thr protein kinase)
MSHELRTPLNGIIGMAELLRSERSDADRAEFLAAIDTSGRNLLEIVNDLLDFSAVEANRLRLRHEPFTLRQAFYEATIPAAVTARDKGLKLSVHLDPDLPELVVGDSGRVRQVLVNLLGNALKFTSEGEVSLSARVRSTRRGTVLLRVLVRDTGPGIDADHQEAIFRPFEQADGSATRSFGGTGLGLSISRALVSAMRGKLWCRSTPGQGSTFGFLIPLVPAEAGTPAPVVPGAADPIASSPLRPGLRVLVAEDHPINQRLIRRLLERDGCQVTLVENGQRAVDLHAAANFDLILMDLQMPVLDGIDATRTIRRAEAVTGRRTPIIAVTAHALTSERQRCRDAGMDDVVTKPVDPAALRHAIEQVLMAPA